MYNLVCVISDNESEILLNSLLQCMTNLCDMNTVAAKLDNYESQACKRAFKFGSCSRRKMKYTPPWYDNECRPKRSLAIKAGERVSSPEDKETHNIYAENTGLVNNLNSVNISKNVLKTLNSHIIRIVWTCGGNQSY